MLLFLLRNMMSTASPIEAMPVNLLAAIASLAGLRYLEGTGRA
jgi:hypothetical protein